ncbi:hypothetical protein [Falsiroseomonas sp. E2-1-a4]|uniref:hypothetical protein n=1 Tax=Falsiroseomonas sp. E2-1-a4 TaxID=3239299 RepID=UPI003F2AD4D6
MSDSPGGSTTVAVTGWIMTYLCAQPAASDTVRGIREWWLSRVSPPPPEDAVLAILEDLARAGLVLRQVNPDRTVLWSAGPGFSAQPKRAAAGPGGSRP